MDTMPTKGVTKLVKDSDLLVCEATFAEKEREMAVERAHMTAKDAATIAKEAGVKKLVLSHFSQRYEDLKPLLKEAREVHKDSVIGEDFMSFVLK